MWTNLDEPCTTNAHPPKWDLSTRGTRENVSKNESSIVLEEAQTRCRMARQVVPPNIQEFVEGVMIWVLLQVDHFHSLTPDPVLISNCRGCSHGAKTTEQ
jgi:hypothetical protein